MVNLYLRDIHSIFFLEESRQKRSQVVIKFLKNHEIIIYCGIARFQLEYNTQPASRRRQSSLYERKEKKWQINKYVYNMYICFAWRLIGILYAIVY